MYIRIAQSVNKAVNSYLKPAGNWQASKVSETLLRLNDENWRYMVYYKYSTLPRGILIYIIPKVGIFHDAEDRSKY